MNNPNSLRQQLIDVMTPRLGEKLAESVFQHDLWPVLQAAMAAGELLVSRNTVPQVPVHKAIHIWLHGCQVITERVLKDRHTVTRQQLLKLVTDLGRMGRQALSDADAIEKGDGR